ALNLGKLTAAEGLEKVTQAMALKFFEKQEILPPQQVEWRGYRDLNAMAVRADPIYKARPLNGIWSVAPYFHNGSLPNLYELLSPVGERQTTFWVGSKRFDPVRVGFETKEEKGLYQFKLDQPGNSNSGHEFRDGPKGKGVIGPLLTPDDRWALIEYLKSI